MLSKEARKERNEMFWAAFKEVMRKVSSSSNRRVNWLSYRTDVKDTYVRLVCDGKLTALCYDIQFRDQSVKDIFWEQLGELKKVMENSMNYPTIWEENYENSDGKIIGRIYWKLDDVNFYNDDDWEKIHLFFRDRLVEFDSFYQEFKDILIALVE
jgi:hypothetical protein